MRRLVTAVLATAVLASAVAAAPAIAATAAAGTKLTAAHSDEYGVYLADAGGRTLYVFTGDTSEPGPGSACDEACAQAWPPLLSKGVPMVGKKLDRDLVGTIRRADGSSQVTYAGRPLYYYINDTGPGAVTGDGIEGFGGDWGLVAPDGSMIE